MQRKNPQRLSFQINVSLIRKAGESSDEDTFLAFSERNKTKNPSFFETGAFDAAPVKVFWGMCTLSTMLVLDLKWNCFEGVIFLSGLTWLERGGAGCNIDRNLIKEAGQRLVTEDLSTPPVSPVKTEAEDKELCMALWQHKEHLMATADMLITAEHKT